MHLGYWKEEGREEKEKQCGFNVFFFSGGVLLCTQERERPQPPPPVEEEEEEGRSGHLSVNICSLNPVAFFGQTAAGNEEGRGEQHTHTCLCRGEEENFRSLFLLYF